uniref:Peptidase aspartic putative domain-containing protein n=1 Tax=Anguilla anguilla TaxID=7936 RepID=A0A0E9XFE6_ANGAN
MSCKICSLTHPTILHIEQRKTEENKKDYVSTNTEKKVVSSALVSLERSIHTGTGDNQTLAIIPVQVKLSDSNNSVRTYAFLDLGSSATLCMESLRKQLNANGRKT